jgi:ParB-like chromosome segregation protein Spo0J
MARSANGKGLAMVPVDRCDMLRRNPQYLTPAMMDAMVKSIKRDGFLAPILVRPRKGGRYEVVSGNHRLMAAREAGLTEVPAVVAKMDDKQVQRAAVNLNTIHGDPTPELLAPFLAEMPDDVLADIHLQDDLLTSLCNFDASLAEALSRMERPERSWGREPSTSPIGQCICPTCGKHHIAATAPSAS